MSDDDDFKLIDAVKDVELLKSHTNIINDINMKMIKSSFVSDDVDFKWVKIKLDKGLSNRRIHPILKDCKHVLFIIDLPNYDIDSLFYELERFPQIEALGFEFLSSFLLADDFRAIGDYVQRSIITRVAFLNKGIMLYDLKANLYLIEKLNIPLEERLIKIESKSKSANKITEIIKEDIIKYVEEDEDYP